MLDHQRNSNIQNKLKIDIVVSLKLHQEYWLDHLKWIGMYLVPRLALQGTKGHGMT